MSAMNIRNTVMKAIAWPAVTWMLAALYCSSMKNPNSPACSLNVESAEGYLQDGDIMLGILLDIFCLMGNEWKSFTEHPKKECVAMSASSLQYYRHFLAAIFAIEEINQDQNILPNVTLGFHIHDSWASERKAISSTFSMLTGSSDYVPNYKCTQNRIPSAFIGHLLSSVSNVMYQISSIYGFPQVSYGAVDPAFSDRIRFPLFYRTVPSETAQYQVIIQLIKAFNWNWVGMISSDDETHQKASEEMKDEIIKNGICLNNFLKKIHFKTRFDDEFFFNEKGEVLGHFVIINWNIFQNETVTTRHVGTFNSSQSPGLAIDKEAILWPSHFNGIPVSRCSASCLPGYRKTFVEGKQVCCYQCVRCSESEISPLPDMENCIKCHEDQWSNESRDKCIMRLVEFLSYKEPLGVALTTTALVLSFCTTAVFRLFLKHKKSPIVKANNQELSYILLLSLMLSFLCSLLFIGRPTKATCFLRQTSFGIIFAICISSILGKTITVIIAFTATRPGSLLRNYVGTRVPKYILLLCTLPEVFICALWLIISPPFPDYDTHSATGKIILQCNEGSPSAFYIMVGYIALLAFVSFFVAYLARKLPDIFNEAQYITFSMLLFCSVWISFILAYVSTTGKYLAAVEIFAILVSSAGLLGLIFIPKCYFILIKQPVNTRHN
eukprot:XP_012824272.1 PREDICTED: vomeronasal type-2 receptor 26-like [Xenopus tropicalis]